jgi:DNA-binding NarL/FixJ family response regulator
VVVLTSLRDAEVDQALTKLGVRLILHKPMLGEAIVAALQGVLAG